MTTQRPSAFHAGAHVTDREDDDADPMLVLDPNVGPADQVDIDDLNATVADVNEHYPADDPVVRVVFVSWLDRHVPGWTDWRTDRQFAETLRDYADDWGVPLETYDYPESRLCVAVDSFSGGGDGGGRPSEPSPAGQPTPEPNSATVSKPGPTSATDRVPAISAEGTLVARAQR